MAIVSPLTEPRLPFDVLRLVCEEAVSLGSSQSDASRQANGYNCCLASWVITSWIEPLLYERVVLKTPEQVHAFDRTLATKSPEFLTRWVKSLWILTDEFDFEAKLTRLFTICNGLKSLVCYGSSSNFLRHIRGSYWSRPSSDIHLDVLTLVKPSPDAFTLYEVKKLHIIEGSEEFYSSWNNNIYRQLMPRRDSRNETDKPELRIDMLSIPTTETLLWIISGTIPAFQTSRSVRAIRIHVRWMESAEAVHQGEHTEWTPTTWLRCFRYSTNSEKSIVEINIEEPSEDEQARLRKLTDTELAKEVVLKQEAKWRRVSWEKA